MKNFMMERKITFDRKLFLVSAYVMCLLLLRAKLTGSIYLFFLIWNVFLAAIPYIITDFLDKNRRIKPILFISLALLWLLFLPNAFYIMTDLMHIAKSSDTMFWLDLSILTASAFSGFIFGIRSTLKMCGLLAERFRFRATAVFDGTVSLLCGIGIFLGRELRLNSWDIFVRPAELADAITTLGTREAIAFIFSISSFIWLTLQVGRHINSKNNL